jgi:hypothetical protein
MDAQPVQTAEEFATELHAQWMREMSDRKRGFYGEPDDYYYVRLGKLARLAGTFYLYRDQDGGFENGIKNRDRELEVPGYEAFRDQS